jgi:hypothetical protein
LARGKAVPFETDVGSGTLTLHIPRPQQPGFYEVQQGKNRYPLAVNIDPRESELRRIDEASLLERFENEGVAVEVRSPDSGESILPAGGRPFWGSCFVAAMSLIAVELLLVGFWRR